MEVQSAKRLRKKAAKMRAAQRRSGARAEPLETWMRRAGDDGRADAYGFACIGCGAHVPWHGGGTRHRNHCPWCLASRHLDEAPGDRAADCGGVMDAVAIWRRDDGEWSLIHRCRRCGALSSNRIAADDSPARLLQLAARPLADPPFPLDRLGPG